MGLLFGILAIGALTPQDRMSLLGYLHNFINLEMSRPTYHGIFKPALATNLKMLGLLYILGVSVAGMPLVIILLFFRGFVLGFAASFLIGTMHWQGIWLATISIVLENIFIVPALLIVSAVALGFSWDLISPKSRFKRASLTQGFAFFTGLVVVMAFAVVVGTALQAFATPFFMHLLSRWGV